MAIDRVPRGKMTPRLHNVERVFLPADFRSNQWGLSRLHRWSRRREKESSPDVIDLVSRSHRPFGLERTYSLPVIVGPANPMLRHNRSAGLLQRSALCELTL